MIIALIGLFIYLYLPNDWVDYMTAVSYAIVLLGMSSWMSDLVLREKSSCP